MESVQGMEKKIFWGEMGAVEGNEWAETRELGYCLPMTREEEFFSGHTYLVSL